MKRTRKRTGKTTMRELPGELNGIAEKLLASRRLLLLCHQHPDGDTLGSAAALALTLSSLGDHREVCVFCADPVPGYLSLLADALPPMKEDFVPDCTAAIDIASLSLLGVDPTTLPPIDVKIDHHRISDPFADLCYVDSTAAACGEIVYEMLTGMLGEKALPPLALSALYLALSGDTGGFRYTNTTPKTLRIAASLMEAGADTALVNHALFESRSHAEVRAIRVFYESLRFYDGGRVALSVITREMKEQNDLSDEALGLVSGLSREIEGVSLGLTLRQNSNDPTKFKLSARSDEQYDACELCRKFGGGGHIRAAGAEITAASVKEAVEAVLTAAGVKKTEDCLFR